MRREYYLRDLWTTKPLPVTATSVTDHVSRGESRELGICLAVARVYKHIDRSYTMKILKNPQFKTQSFQGISIGRIAHSPSSVKL